MNRDPHVEQAALMMTSVLEIVESRRIAAGMTAEAVAKKAGVSVRFYRLMRAAPKSTSLSTLIGLANAVGMTLKELLEEAS